VEECAPIPGWLLTPGTTLEDELSIRQARIAGLDLRAAQDEEDDDDE
jgi:hypothetical protein